MLRPERLEDQIQFLVSTLIQRELRDPDLGFVTVTAVRLSPDRSVAKVFFTVLEGEAQVELTRKALGRAAGFLRAHLGQRLKLRRVPELRFMPDATLEEGNRIEEIFAKIREEEAARPAAPPVEEGAEPGAEPEPGT